MSVEEITEVTDELVEAIDSLIPQLSSSSKPLTREEVEQFVGQESVYLFAYRAKGRILGMLTLATFIIPTGHRGIIEDVVVDADARGTGAGSDLVEAALQKGRDLGLRNIDLTSRPTREAANRLYRRCGFEPRETNVYRYAL